MIERRLENIPLKSVKFKGGIDPGRPVDESKVEMIAKSMGSTVGQISPIYVHESVGTVKGVATTAFRVVAGQHRVHAARLLGWTHIQAFTIPKEVQYLDVELIEIDENLCRSDLTPAQRAASVKRRKEIWEALGREVELEVAQLEPPQDGKGQQVGQLVPPVKKHGRRQELEFAAETAELTGENKRTVNRQLARAEALGDDLHRIAGTSLDKGVELDALKDLPDEERKELIEKAVKGEEVSARKPKTKPSTPNLHLLISTLRQATSLTPEAIGDELGFASDDDFAKLEELAPTFENLGAIYDLLMARGCL